LAAGFTPGVGAPTLELPGGLADPATAALGVVLAVAEPGVALVPDGVPPG